MSTSNSSIDEVRTIQNLDRLLRDAQFHKTQKAWDRYNEALADYRKKYVKGEQGGTRDTVSHDVSGPSGLQSHAQRRLEALRDDSRSRRYRN